VERDRLTDPPRRGGGKARPCSQTTEHIPLLEFDPVGAEQSEKLRLEVFFPVWIWADIHGSRRLVLKTTCRRIWE